MSRALALIAVLMAAAGCTRNSTPPQAANNTAGDDALKQALSRYVVEFLRRNPTTNTYLGGAGLDATLRAVDGTLRDHSAAALQEEDQWLGRVQVTLDMFSADNLSTGTRIDRDVALAQIRFLLRQHQTRRYQERALDTYVSEPFRALDWQLQGMTQTGPKTYGTAEEWALVAQRVTAVPRFLETARQQLLAGVSARNVPDPRMLQRDGLNTSEANAKYFAQELPAIASDRISGPKRNELLMQIRTASADASAAYVKFRDFVASTYFDRARPARVKPEFAADRFAMGEED